MYIHMDYHEGNMEYGRRGLVCKGYRPIDGAETEMRFDWDTESGRVALCMGAHGVTDMPAELVWMGHRFSGLWPAILRYKESHEGCDDTELAAEVVPPLCPQYTRRNGKCPRKCYEGCMSTGSDIRCRLRNCRELISSTESIPNNYLSSS